LIAGFAQLSEPSRSRYQPLIVCKISKETRERYTRAAIEHGLVPDSVVFSGYVPDEDLRVFYATCSVFVFPSLHEGFGLPVLEAMASGAPVIGSNCTSIPEIIDRADALFDPRDPRETAQRMEQVLLVSLDTEFRENLKDWGRKRAQQFTWESCARKALAAFEELHAPRRTSRVVSSLSHPNHRPLLAFVSPLPPERSGIAGYSAKLLPNLARYCQIVCIVDQKQVTDPWISSDFAIRDTAWFKANASRFERILYQFGNSPPHKQMFDLLERHPGVIVLHDFYLSSAPCSIGWRRPVMRARRSGEPSIVRTDYQLCTGIGRQDAKRLN
jgi:hypothetical protein